MKPVIFNQQQRFVRTLLLLAAAAGLAAVTGGVVAMLMRSANGVPVVIAIVSGVVCITLLICAAFTVPAARRATLMITRMQAGDALAHWVYSPEFWKAWVTRERRWFGFATWGAVAFVVAVVGIIVYALLTTPLAINPTRQRDALVASGGATIVIGFILGGMAAYRRRRSNRLLACGECYLMSDAAYIGGDFFFWNAQMRGLQTAVLVPPEGARPAAIELTMGASPNAARAQRSIGLAALAAGGLYFGEYKNIARIPVPLESMSDAERVVQLWNQNKN